MSSSVRTTHATHPLLITSKMVVVLLLIFLPAIAFANPIYQSSSNRYAIPSTVGAQSMQYQPASYQMTNMPNYQISTTYSPAQTLYTPFSSETPTDKGPSQISGRRNSDDEEWEDTSTADPDFVPVGESWIMLAFAAMAAVVIRFRKKQTA